MAKVENVEAEEKKRRQRSPNYPAASLRDAVERVRKLYETDGKAGAPPNLAVVHIGFASAHGQALAVLAALKKFGLVETANGRIVPTQRAIEIINLPESDPRRIQALKDAALSPLIYADLIQKHRDTGFPSDDVLESELVTYGGFNKNTVSRFVRDFRDTLDFAGLSDLSELKSETEEKSGMAESEKVAPRKPEVPFPSSISLLGEKEKVSVNSWTLSPQVNAELRINGDVTAEDLELLRDYVEITIKALGRKAKQG